MKRLRNQSTGAAGLMISLSGLAMWLVISLSVPALPVASAGAKPSTTAAIASEPFSYAAGEVHGQNGSTGWGGAWTAQTAITEVVNASLSYAVPGGGTVSGGSTALQISGNDDNAAFRPLAGLTNADDVYVSFLVRFTGTVDNDDFLALWFDNLTVGTHTNLPNIGIRGNRGDGSGTEDFFARAIINSEVYSTDITPGTDYFVVGRLFKSTPGSSNLYDRFSLWVNPSFGDSGSPQATSMMTSTTSGFSNIGFRSVNLDGGDSILVDELCFGTTWGDCVPAACTSITCPANITQSNDSNQCGAVVTYPAPTPNGSCGTITCSPASGSFFPVGITTVTCTSSAGPTCSFTVTVNDSQPPTITCPPNQVKSNDPNQCGAVVNYPPPTVSDNCPNVGTPTCSPASGSFFPVGTTTVTCMVSDAHSNTANCTFTVTVNDTQPPTITCPPNQTAVTPQNVCPLGGTPCLAVTFPAPTASDNCPGVVVVCNPPSGSCLPLGTTTVTCTATDASGNTATCSFTVTVFDVCLQDDSTPTNVLLFNSATGDYRFCCNGTTFTGKGKVTRQGCVFTLEHNPLDRRVRGTADKGVFRGNASIQSPPGRLRCNITDGDIRNNTCVCQ